MDIYFVTGNKGKVESLRESFKVQGLGDINIIQKDLSIAEIQADHVREVSKDKALKAFQILNAPVVVEDGAFVIDALNGFPGVYAKYILGTIGVDGILKLLEGENNRNCKFNSCTTFIDENGEIHQFDRDTIEFEISRTKSDVISPYEWSELWRVLYVKEYKKLLCDFNETDLETYYETVGQRGSLQNFVSWFRNRYENNAK